MPFTGRELGKKILEEEKITNVSINPIQQLDHYNPKEKKIHIGTDKLDKKVLLALRLLHTKLVMQFKIKKNISHLSLDNH